MSKYFISAHFFIPVGAVIFSSAISLVQAEIYKQVDAEGRVTYSNVKLKGAKKLELEPADTNFGTTTGGATKKIPASKSATPGNFPSVDANTQKQRDSGRKEILQNELAAERGALELAKKAYTDGESNPEVFQKRNANGTSSSYRNVPKFQEKMQNLQADVDVHQRNIELLQQEINNLN